MHRQSITANEKGDLNFGHRLRYHHDVLGYATDNVTFRKRVSTTTARPPPKKIK